MTAEEKEKIKKLRLEGVGYKGIAALIGLSRDNVRGYCKRSGLDGDTSVVSLNFNEKKKRKMVCVYCEKSIKQKEQGRTRRFCSDKCRRQWWNENQDKRNKNETAIYKYICPHCGKGFDVYGNKKRKYCSHNCYIKDRFWRDEDGI